LKTIVILCKRYEVTNGGLRNKSFIFFPLLSS
jgi:hypothetical protein